MATEKFEAEYLKKYFPEERVFNPDIKDMVEKLQLFCRIKGLDKPVYNNIEVAGRYTSSVRCVSKLRNFFFLHFKVTDKILTYYYFRP